MKVIKSYSLDLEVVQMLEEQHTDAYGDIGSRSKTVNDAIRWYLSGEYSMADLIIANDKLKEAVKRANIALTPPPKDTKSWWRILLRI